MVDFQIEEQQRTRQHNLRQAGGPSFPVLVFASDFQIKGGWVARPVSRCGFCLGLSNCGCPILARCLREGGVSITSGTPVFDFCLRLHGSSNSCSNGNPADYNFAPCPAVCGGSTVSATFIS